MTVLTGILLLAVICLPLGQGELVIPLPSSPVAVQRGEQGNGTGVYSIFNIRPLLIPSLFRTLLRMYFEIINTD